MEWNIVWPNPANPSLVRYVGHKGEQVDTMSAAETWLQENSRISRYGRKFFSSAERKRFVELHGELPEAFKWHCGSLRYKDALILANLGAVNAVAVANSLLSAIKEVADADETTVQEDAAIPLIFQSLSHILREETHIAAVRHSTLLAECERQMELGADYIKPVK